MVFLSIFYDQLHWKICPLLLGKHQVCGCCGIEFALMDITEVNQTLLRLLLHHRFVKRHTRINYECYQATTTANITTIKGNPFL